MFCRLDYMHFKISQQDKEKISQLIKIKETNIAFASMLYAAFDDMKAIQPAKNNEEFIQNLMKFWKLNSKNKENINLINFYIKSRLQKIDPLIVLDNPYVKTIPLNIIKDNKYALSYFKQLAYQPFAYDDIEVDDEFHELQSVGFFSVDLAYPIISVSNTIWMSVNPNEIITMNPAINEGKGNVLVLGLGLGYYPFMISPKKQVTSIIIVENDQKIIELFNKYILPYFPYKEKITIIRDDAFDYLKNKNLPFDYMFVDLWHSPEDGLPMYLKIKEIIRNKYRGPVFYWLEKSILAMLRRCFLTLVEEQLNHAKEDNYLKAKNDYDRIINNLYFKTKNKTINSFIELKEMLKNENLKHY